jgi:hypothetical protein
MKTKVLHYSKGETLYAIFLLALLLGLTCPGIGQTKIGKESVVSCKKDLRFQVANIQSDQMVENNQLSETAILNDGSFENSQPIEPPAEGPLANRTASVSGNWNNTATWGGSSVPVAGDNVTINSGITVTIPAGYNAACATITFAAVAASSAITINGTNSLTVSGLVTMPRPSASQSCTININAGTASFGSLTMSSTSAGATRTDIVNVTTGSLSTGTVTTLGIYCQINITSTGSITFSGSNVITGTPTLTLNTGSTVNYSSASAQTIYAATYGALSLSGAGTKTIAASATVTVNGNLSNNSILVLTAGTSTTSTWLVMGGNVTNTGTMTLTASYIRFIFSSANAQTFTNNGTVTSPVSSFDVSNTNASGLTLAGTGFNVTRANLFVGTVTNSNKITLGTGGTSYAVVQRGVSANTSPAGNFDVAPNFNIGTDGYILLYDNGSIPYNTGYEVPGSLACDLFYIFDAADVTLTTDLTINEELNFYGGTGTPTLRIGAHTLTLGGTITYTVAGTFYGGANSNLVINGSTNLNAITNGVNNLTINNPGGVILSGAVFVNNILTLTDGTLNNGTYLTMASGTSISRTSTGTLSVAPTFGSSVNVIYTGSSAVNTGYEIPTSPTVLYNLTTNTGGVTQNGIPSGGTVSTIYTQGFNAAPADWTTEIVTDAGSLGTPTISYVTSASSTYPAVSFTEGGIGVEFNSYDCDAGDQIRLKKNSSPLSTSGKTNITVVFDWYYYTGTYTGADQVTVQWSTNGTTWNSASTYPRTGTTGWTTINCVLPSGAENQTTLYIAFLFTSGYGYNCHLDNLKVNVNTPGTPTPSTCTISGTFDLTNGTYTIGGTNTLAINGGLSGTNVIIGSTTSNLSIGGVGANFTLPSIINGLNNFTMARPNGVTIAATKSLTVAGTLINSYGTDGLIIEPGGSLIENSGVEATVVRDYTGNEWHLISPPISDATAEMFVGLYLQNHTESTNVYTDIIDSLTNLNVMQGYALWNDNDSLFEFKGSLNTGIIGSANNVTRSGQGWNLVGNPYPSYIDWDASSGWTKTNVNNATYRHVNNATWASYVGGVGTNGGTQYIAPCQGFFVGVTSGQTVGTLSMTNNVRTNNTSAFFKDEIADIVRIQVSGNGYSDETVIRILDEATPDFDSQWDAVKFLGIVPEAPAIYSSENGMMSINSLPPANTIPMGVNCGVPCQLTISATETSEFPNIILEDVITGIKTDLKTDSYTFAYDVMNDNRFVLHFTPMAVSQNFEELINFSSINGELYISVPDNMYGTVKVYNMIGQEVISTGINSTITKVQLDVNAFYLVQIISNKGVVTKKVFVN